MITWPRKLGRERRRQIREAADLDAGGDVGHFHASRLLPSLSLSVAPTRLAGGQPSLERAHGAHYEQHALLLRDLGEPFTDRTSFPLQERVVVEEEHADDLDAVCACPELRTDHLTEL